MQAQASHDVADGSRPMKDRWVERVLGITLPPANEAAAAPIGIVAFSKLVLRWRAAEQETITCLNELGTRVLQHPLVKDTPVAAEVESVIPELTRLVPSFADQLRDALDDIYNAPTTDKKRAASAAASQAIAGYRARLQAETRLQDLESFAQQNFGQPTLHSPLFAILDEIDRSIAI